MTDHVYEVYHPKTGIKEYTFGSPYMAVEKAADDYNSEFDYQLIRGGPCHFGVRVKGSRKGFTWIEVEGIPITVYNLKAISEDQLSDRYLESFATFANNTLKKAV